MVWLSGVQDRKEGRYEIGVGDMGSGHRRRCDDGQKELGASSVLDSPVLRVIGISEEEMFVENVSVRNGFRCDVDGWATDKGTPLIGGFVEDFGDGALGKEGRGMDIHSKEVLGLATMNGNHHTLLSRTGRLTSRLACRTRPHLNPHGSGRPRPITLQLIHLGSRRNASTRHGC
jgi:hypothetical protein